MCVGCHLYSDLTHLVCLTQLHVLDFWQESLPMRHQGFLGPDKKIRLFDQFSCAEMSTYLSMLSRYRVIVSLKSLHFLTSNVSNSFLMILDIFSKFS